MRVVLWVVVGVSMGNVLLAGYLAARCVLEEWLAARRTRRAVRAYRRWVQSL